MDYKNFLLNLNTISLSFLNNEINIYSKKQLENIYNIGFDEYINSNKEIKNILLVNHGDEIIHRNNFVFLENN